MSKPAIRAGRCDLTRLVQVARSPDTQRLAGGSDERAPQQRQTSRLREPEDGQGKEKSKGNAQPCEAANQIRHGDVVQPQDDVRRPRALRPPRCRAGTSARSCTAENGDT